MSVKSNIGIILAVIILAVLGFWIAARLGSPIIGVPIPDGVPKEKVLNLSVYYPDGSSLTVEATSPEGNEVLRLSARLLCRLYGQMRMGTLSSEATSELRNQSTYLDIEMEEGLRVFVRCRTGRSGWIETRRLLLVLSHPERYEGWVVLHRHAEISGLSGGFFAINQEYEADCLALVELKHYVDSLRNLLGEMSREAEAWGDEKIG